MEILYLNFEVNNLPDMTYESHDEWIPPSAEKREQRVLMMVIGSQNSILAVVSKFAWRQSTWWQVQGFILGEAESNSEWEKAFDEIRPLGNKRNSYINSVFAEKRRLQSWNRGRFKLATKQEGAPGKRPCTRFGDNQILSHLCCPNKLKIRINATHLE